LAFGASGPIGYSIYKVAFFCHPFCTAAGGGSACFAIFSSFAIGETG
jgi:hypothetical protein